MAEAHALETAHEYTTGYTHPGFEAVYDGPHGQTSPYWSGSHSEHFGEAHWPHEDHRAPHDAAPFHDMHHGSHGLDAGHGLAGHGLAGHHLGGYAEFYGDHGYGHESHDALYHDPFTYGYGYGQHEYGYHGDSYHGDAYH